MWEVHPAWDRYKEPVFRAYFDANLASGGSLTILDRASGAVIGASRYWEVDPATRSVEIGATYLARAQWGSGVNREVKRLMIAHALGAVEAVTFRVGATNIRSRRALEKIGGRLTDRTDMSMMAGMPVEHRRAADRPNRHVDDGGDAGRACDLRDHPRSVRRGTACPRIAMMFAFCS